MTESRETRPNIPNFCNECKCCREQRTDEEQINYYRGSLFELAYSDEAPIVFCPSCRWKIETGEITEDNDLFCKTCNQFWIIHDHTSLQKMGFDVPDGYYAVEYYAEPRYPAQSPISSPCKLCQAIISRSTD